MSLAAPPLESVERNVRRAVSDVSPFLEHLARFGFAAKGVVYLIIGMLAALAPIGLSSGPTGTGGVVKTLLRQPMGWAMLGTIAFGLFGFGIFQLMRAIENADGLPPDWKGFFLRIGCASNAFVQFALGIAAIGMIFGWKPPGGADDDANARTWTAWAMSYPFGRWAVGVVAISTLIYGLCQIYLGLRGRLDPRLHWNGAGNAERRWWKGISCFGVAGRGAVFALLAVCLLTAAWNANANEARGLSGTLIVLAEQPYGPALLFMAALGLAGYGVYDFVLARYRHIRM